MSWKLLAGFACGMALLLGACSGNNASGTTVVTPDTGSGGSDGGGSDGAEPTEPDAAEKAYMDAVAAVMRATAAARSATPTTRDTAIMLIATARAELAKAVTAAEAAVAAAEGPAAIGAAAKALNKANRYRTAQETALDTARASFAWYGKDLVRYTFASGDVVVPREGTNVATIKRIPRTIDTSATDDTQKANPAAFKSDTFKDVMYSAGDTVFSGSGDEFKVDGYINKRASSYTRDTTILTGLKLTNAGLVIRTGGSGENVARDSLSVYRSDFTDFRRDITQYANDSDGDNTADAVFGQNGWDLEIAFDEPQTKTVANGHASWTGNGNFYWKSIVFPRSSQLATDGDYYDADAFKQPEGYKDLGTYEVWLSNHIGVDAKLEPISGTAAAPCPDGSIGFSCPDDDVNLYLNYAAYGLFVYAVDAETYRGTGGLQAFNGHLGRINTIHFGYSAFGTGVGQKTKDIGKAVTNGKFHGYTLAYEVLGDQNLEQGNTNPIATKLLRGEVTLTVNIPKGLGAATLEGTMTNFQRWHDENKYWTAYADSFTVELDLAIIDENGTFSGETEATPSTVLGSDNSTGVYKGNFYGPRTGGNDLEIAGSWTLGVADTNDANKDLHGSFGAKQRPAPSN